MNETQMTVTEWGTETFGHGHDAMGMAVRMNIEVAELLAELVGDNPELQDLVQSNIAASEALSKAYHAIPEDDPDARCLPSPRAASECADVLIVLWQVASRVGAMLVDEVNKKMAINRARQWKKLDSGRHQHI